MRSRYSAFATANVEHLARTWHPDHRPRRIHLGEGRRWTGLEVIATEGGGLLDQAGTVEFRATHREPGGTGDEVLHEVSSFVRVDGRWLYTKGT